MDTNVMILTCAVIATIFIVGHYGTKVLDWIERRIQSKYKDSKAHFMADCYRLQQKWAEKGEYDFAMAMSHVINSFNLPAEDDQPQTAAGKEAANRLRVYHDEQQ